MGHWFPYAFLTVYILLSVWLVVSGVLSFLTRKCTIWVGNRVYSFTGRKAIGGGIGVVIAGLLFIALAVYQWRSIMAHDHT